MGARDKEGGRGGGAFRSGKGEIIVNKPHPFPNVPHTLILGCVPKGSWFLSASAPSPVLSSRSPSAAVLAPSPSHTWSIAFDSKVSPITPTLLCLAIGVFAGPALSDKDGQSRSQGLSNRKRPWNGAGPRTSQTQSMFLSKPQISCFQSLHPHRTMLHNCLTSAPNRQPC